MKRRPLTVARPGKVECACPGLFTRVMEPRGPAGKMTGAGPGSASRLKLDQDGVKQGLGRLVLALVKLLHELLERQAIRRLEAGSLLPGEIERLGLTLMSQAREIDRLRREFGLSEADLNLDLGPLGRLFKE